MRKCIIQILIVLAIGTRATAQEIKLNRSDEKRSSYILTENFESFEKNILDSICTEFKVIKTRNFRGTNLYNFKFGMSQLEFAVLGKRVQI